MSDEQLRATVEDGPDAPFWSDRQRLLVQLADELHDTASVSESLWTKLSGHWDSAQLIELVAIAGFYHLVSFTANAAGVRPEQYAERFPAPPRSAGRSG
jgi:alkylhydroperoxidase family enzyme